MQNSLALWGMCVAAHVVGPVARAHVDESFPLPHYAAAAGQTDFLLLDADHDGRLDVLMTTWLANNTHLHVLRGGPGCTLGQPSSQWLPVGVYGLTATELDGDGVADLVAAGDGNPHGCVLVAMGRASGGFEPAVSIALDIRPTRVVAADVDEDGAIDLLVHHALYAYDGGARLLRGRGDGTFEPAVDLGIGEKLLSPRLVDLDGDGHLDLAAITWVYPTLQWTLRVYAGDGHGHFAVRHSTALPPRSVELAYEDFDGDGRPDAIVSADNSAPMPALLQLYPTLADGSSAAPTTLMSGVRAGRVAVADVDDDGRLDVVIPYRTEWHASGGVGIARGLGGLAFAPVEVLRTGLPNTACAAADLDRDGDVDLVTFGDHMHLGLGILRARSPGEFEVGIAPHALDSAPRDIAAGDWSGDGLADLVTIGTENEVARWRGRGNGTFEREAPLATPHSPESVLLHDFDSDGRADTVIASAPGWQTPGTLSVWRTTHPTLARDDYGLGAGEHRLDCADLDGDGRTDLAVASDARVRVFHARADGTFEAAANVPMGPPGYGMEFRCGDFDGDGRSDLVAQWDTATVIAFGSGAGAFEHATAAAGVNAEYLFGVGDFDLDGCDDLVTARSVPELSLVPIVTSVWYGSPTLVFVGRRFDGEHLGAAFVADFNDNGLPDLLMLASHTLTVFTGDGQRGFDSPRFYGAGFLREGALADFDLDGRIDVAATVFYENAFSIFLQR